MSKIYYIIPDLHRRNFSILSFLRSIRHGTAREYLKNSMFHGHKAVGGVKVIYQHCMMLKTLGYEAYPLIMGSYVGNFFGFDLELKYIKDVGFQLDEGDIVISTEYLPYQGLMFNGGTKILFMQNWFNIDRMLKKEDIGKSYFDLGYDHVITCGAYCSQMVSEKMGIKSTTITNGIDQEKFYSQPGARVPGRVLALSRKNIDDLRKIVKLVENNGTKVDLVVADGLTQAELIEEYQKTDIFLATGYPEGLPLPPLEAMNCGCATVGFTGGGAREYMIDNVTAMVSNDGDCVDAAKKLEAVLNDPSLKEKIRKNGYEIASKYTLKNTEALLLNFYKSIDCKPHK